MPNPRNVAGMTDQIVREPHDTRPFGDTPVPPGGQLVDVGDVSVHGEGSFTLPVGMTVEEAERLVREADAARQQED